MRGDPFTRQVNSRGPGDRAIAVDVALLGEEAVSRSLIFEEDPDFEYKITFVELEKIQVVPSVDTAASLGLAVLQGGNVSIAYHPIDPLQSFTRASG